jgi:hypothetical protein
LKIGIRVGLENKKRQLTSLHELYARNTKVTDQGIERLQKSLPMVRVDASWEKE